MDKKHPNHFTTFDAIRIVGLKRDRLQDWINRGMITPAFREEDSRGKKSYFDRWGLYMIKLFHYLVTNGISRDEAAKWIRWLTDDKPRFEKQSSKLKAVDADFVSIKRKNGKILQGSITWGPSTVVRPDDDIDDVFTIKFQNIIKAVNTAIER